MKKFIGILLILGTFYLINILYVEKIRKCTVIYGVYEMTEFERKSLEEIKTSFMKINPRINIVFEEIPRRYEAIKNGLIREGTPIDIVLIPDVFLPIFKDENLIQPLTRWSGFELTSDDHRLENYSHSKHREVYALLYNYNLNACESKNFARDGKKFEEVLRGMEDRGVAYPMITDLVLEDYGVEKDYEEKYLKNFLENPLVAYSKDLLDRGLMFRAGETAIKNKYKAFIEQRTGFIVSPMDGIEYIQSLGVAFDFQVIPIPEEDSFYHTILGNRYVVSRKSKNLHEAFQFIEYVNKYD